MSEFWTFTLGVYGREGVQSSVIHLQDERGADVNLLLYAMWTASLGMPAFDKMHVSFLGSRVGAWRDTAIEPLRAVRVALGNGVSRVSKDEADTMRKAVLKLEIEAERIEQAVIEAANTDTAGRESVEPDPVVVATNLGAVMALSDEPLDGENIKAIRALIVAACPESSAADVDQAMTVIS
ncbi:MAG: TIGR02444 family protein [Alphaproteobacteria bacterium]|jgi:uncharacterized protein (TIGR02444 family)|nr:TIGR02444 family protein [Rhodospirillaceae bacterium]MBT6205981.1 TIGR02444 family protein [Rhodospirillaceae bacterium]MBT6512370.1 TIGR02444 family protein [Rhodospirillaceae bacterium]MBT7648754.1 TIGR02444 family protein [Rhodospirillaceae bacterium]MDG2480076.1 TIGR02444 family protein [Alphaproteobacteria bacterium]